MSYRYRLRNKTIKYKADMDKSIHSNTTVQLGQSVPTEYLLPQLCIHVVCAIGSGTV